MGRLVMIRVLGPVDVLTTEGAAAIGGHHARTLLAALALSANHSASIDRLSQIIWGDQPPPSRDNTLQTYVHRLRSLVGEDRIKAQDHSYELRVTREELDALKFERVANRASDLRDSPERCLPACKEALALWRGPAFGELADTDPFRLEAIRLDEIRMFVMELHLESQIEMGKADLVVGTLEALVEEYPYRERLWQLLIKCLALCDRRVEALRACASLREVLAEAGLAPAGEIDTLEERILAGGPPA